MFAKITWPSRTAAMIEAKSLGQLSLSHLHDTNNPVPLEVSLCNRAARPMCTVEWVAVTLDAALRYKAMSQYGRYNTSAMDTSPPTEVPPPATLMDILNNMNPEHRSLVSAAFSDMDAQLSTLKTTNTKSSQRVQELETASSVDKALLKQQITQFLSQINDQTLARYAMADSEAVSNTLCGDNPDTMRRTVDRLLMCCSSVMFNDRASGPPPAKRKPEEPITSINTNTTIPEMETTKRFEPGSQSASEQLRAALSSFN